MVECVQAGARVAVAHWVSCAPFRYWTTTVTPRSSEHAGGLRRTPRRDEGYGEQQCEEGSSQHVKAGATGCAPTFVTLYSGTGAKPSVACAVERRSWSVSSALLPWPSAVAKRGLS